MYNGKNVIIYVIALLWTNERAITLFCTDMGAKRMGTKRAIVCSMVRNFHLCRGMQLICNGTLWHMQFWGLIARGGNSTRLRLVRLQPHSSNSPPNRTPVRAIIYTIINIIIIIIIIIIVNWRANEATETLLRFEIYYSVCHYAL